MTEPSPPPSPAPPPGPIVDWEAFYRDYRKPGFIPGFEITSKLGGGMFGLVFRARKQSIGRDYAIKFLKVDDDDVRLAILAELDAVRHFAQLDHPNLVSIEDRGEVAGIPYIVMAFAGDRTLRDAITQEEPPEQRTAFLLQACRGVQSLHEHSLVHFDLKPANIFLRGTVARVGDYGLSKLMAHSRNSLSMGRGTPYYMAPEMLRRKGDARSDVYAIGVMLYECLTGEVPFRGDSDWEVLRKHEQAKVEFPDSVPAAYRRCITRCMAKDPEARYPSVAELLEDLVGQAPLPGEVSATLRPAGAALPKAGSEDDRDLKTTAQVLADRSKDLAREAWRAAGEATRQTQLRDAAHAFGREVRTAALQVRDTVQHKVDDLKRQPPLRRLQRRARERARTVGPALRGAGMRAASVGFGALLALTLIGALAVMLWASDYARLRHEPATVSMAAPAPRVAVAVATPSPAPGVRTAVAALEPREIQAALAEARELAATGAERFVVALRAHDHRGVIGALLALEELDLARRTDLVRAERLDAFLNDSLGTRQGLMALSLRERLLPERARQAVASWRPLITRLSEQGWFQAPLSVPDPRR